MVTTRPDGGGRYWSEAWWAHRERPATARLEAACREGAGLRVLVPEPVLETIRRGLESAYPGEGCGVLLGEVDGERRVVREAVPAANRGAARNDRYEVDPELLRRLVQGENRGGPDVLGFYHSHPDVDPVPSATDRGRSWPWYAYLVVRVRDGRAAEGRVWSFDADGRPTEGTVVVSDQDAAGAARSEDAPRGEGAARRDSGPRQET